MELVDFLKGLPQKDRERLGHMAGCTGAYVTSIIYKKRAATSLALAVAADKMSNGALDFRSLVSRAEYTDWEYMKQALNSRPSVVYVDDTV
jgi:hypothetical protein